jgi:hypothetical protein
MVAVGNCKDSLRILIAVVEVVKLLRTSRYVMNPSMRTITVDFSKCSAAVSLLRMPKRRRRRRSPLSDNQ